MLPLIMNYLQAELARTRDEDGAVTIEYGILVAVIALGLVAVGVALVAAISGWFTDMGTSVSTLPDGS